jgi:hydrogenase expression/formation protein HypC
MCLAVPGIIIEKQDMMATVDIRGVTRQVSLMLLPTAGVGEYVLIHAGFAVQTIDEEEAQRTLELFKELEAYAENED